MLSTNLIILLAVVAALAFLIALSRFAKNYIKVPPNAVAIISGRKHKLPDGLPYPAALHGDTGAAPPEAAEESAP